MIKLLLYTISITPLAKKSVRIFTDLVVAAIKQKRQVIEGLIFLVVSSRLGNEEVVTDK